MLAYFRYINTVIVYSPKTGNRLVYILKTLLNEGLDVEYQITTDEETFRMAAGPRINYSTENFEGALQIKPQGIIHDHGIKDYHLAVIPDARFEKIFFKSTGQTVPFDLFGAAFWLLSRYEEYLPHKADIYNRFHYRSSLAYQYDFIKSPLINVWLAALKQLLTAQFPELVFTPRRYNFISSIDIDNAYQYKYKGVIRTLAGLVADRNLSKIKKRISIVLNKAPDPFDCYDFLINLHTEKKVPAIYFFFTGGLWCQR